MVVAIASSISLLAAEQPVQPHVLVVAAESLAGKEQVEAAKLVVRTALATPGLNRTERARLRLVDAALVAQANDEPGAKKLLQEALNLDRTVTFRSPVPSQLQELLEDARSMLPPASGPQAPSSSGEVVREPSAKPLIRMVDQLYVSLQLAAAEAADIVLQVGWNYRPFAAQDEAQLWVRQGIVKTDLFNEAETRQAFQRALEFDRAVKLPDYAPPKTAGQFEEMRAAFWSGAPAASPKPLETSAPGMAVVKPPPATHDEPSGAILQRPWLWTTVGGGVLGAGGGVLYLLAKEQHDLITTHSPTITNDAELKKVADHGRALQTGSVVLLGVGAAALSLSFILYQYEQHRQLHATFHVTPNTITLGLSGALP